MSGKFDYVITVNFGKDDSILISAYEDDGYTTTTTICCSGGCSTNFPSASTYAYESDRTCNKDSCKEKDHNCEKNCCEPKNNDGRNTCYWCGRKTKLVDTGMRGFNYCEKCKK